MPARWKAAERRQVADSPVSQSSVTVGCCTAGHDLGERRQQQLEFVVQGPGRIDGDQSAAAQTRIRSRRLAGISSSRNILAMPRRVSLRAKAATSASSLIGYQSR